MRCSKRIIRRLHLFLTISIIGVFCLFVLVPIGWALSTSLKTPQGIMAPQIQIIPDPATMDNFSKLWKTGQFSLFFKNSLFVSSVSVIFILFMAICNGYALSRYDFRGKGLFQFMLLGTQLLPLVIIIVPLFITFSKLHLTDSIWSLIFFNVVIQTPFNTLLMRGFVDGIPKTIDEAAKVDGANQGQVIFLVILPVIVPGIVATTAFAFIGCWNEFLIAFSFVQSKSNFTIPIGLKLLIGEFSVDYGTLAAGSLIALLPPLLLFSYIQKYLVQGMTAGAVKG